MFDSPAMTAAALADGRLPTRIAVAELAAANAAMTGELVIAQ
jgi:hypothetical protein